MTKSICVYCGSSDEVSPDYLRLAAELGTCIAKADLRFVYGGGKVGLMGASAMAAHAAGGKVLGVIPRFLLEYEKLYEDVPHQIVEDMPTRKAMLFNESDAFIVLPGGIGTLEEVIEILSWAKLGLHNKPIIFLDEDGYWAPLLKVFDEIMSRKFAPKSFEAYYIYTTTPEQAVARALEKLR